jgi:hypothetical protein
MNRVVSNRKGSLVVCSLNITSPPCTLLVCLGNFQCISPNQKIYQYHFNSHNCSIALYNVESERCEHILNVMLVISS